jgi:hypothetical protein
MNTLTQEFTLKSNNDKRYQWILGAFGLIQKKDNVLTTDYIAQKFGMNSDYTLYPKCNIVDRITFSAGLNGTGKIYWDESNSLSQKFYLLLNAKVIVTSGKFNWEIWGKNITNTDYQAYCFTLSNAYYVQKGRPVSYGTSITFNF